MKCLLCEKELKKKNRRFCDRNCYNKYIEIYGSVNTYDKNNKQKICINCFKPFSFEKHLPKKRHCSRECFLELKNKNGYKEVECLECGDIFIVYQNSPKQFCNIKCYHKYRKENFDQYIKPKQQKLSIRKSRDVVNNLTSFIGGKTFSPDVKPKPDVVTFMGGYMIAIEVEKQKGRYKLEKRFNTYIENEHNFDLVIVMSRDENKVFMKDYSDVDSYIIKQIKNKINDFYLEVLE